jgi:uncharacterized protein (DUF488 family)
MNTNKLYTIGFTKVSAETFFGKLRKAGVRKILDIRLNNDSQLAGFAKKENLKFFLKEILGCEYVHLPIMAPTQQILDAYKNKLIEWEDYEKQFKELISTRLVHQNVTIEELNLACLLCAEPTPDKCHRRLIAEYLKDKFPDLEISHL